MYTIQISVQELLIFVLCGLGIIIGIILIKILWDIQKTAKSVRGLCENNKDDIRKSIQKMPAILENVEQISNNVKITTDSVASYKKETTGLSTYLQIITDILQAVFHTFSKK
ncbi:MAG: hypothetical protein WC677_08550 [Clostridia bacterium]|jgi:predicted PurR-regulated permease PerM